MPNPGPGCDKTRLTPRACAFPAGIRCAAWGFAYIVGYKGCALEMRFWQVDRFGDTAKINVDLVCLVVWGEMRACAHRGVSDKAGFNRGETDS